MGQVSLARWVNFSVSLPYGIGVVPAAVLSLFWAFQVDPEELGSSSICTGPLGYVFGWGLKTLLYFVAVALLLTGTFHYLSAKRYLRDGSRKSIRATCWRDAEFWAFLGLVVGLANPLVLVLVLGLCVAHVRFALLFREEHRNQLTSFDPRPVAQPMRYE